MELRAHQRSGADSWEGAEQRPVRLVGFFGVDDSLTECQLRCSLLPLRLGSRDIADLRLPIGP